MYDVFSLPDTIFPEGFIWGTATAGHQIEGDNIHSANWEDEQKPEFYTDKFRAPSGRACNHWELYREDTALLKALGHKTYRMSLEWSRIEPVEGEFNKEAVDHYVRELALLKEYGITVFLTLIHFTTPAWFIKKGGFQDMENIRYFERYAEYIVPIVAPYVDSWNILNEFNLGFWKERYEWKKNSLKFHARGYHIVKKYSDKPVSSAHAMVQYTPKRHHDPFDRNLAEYHDWAANGFFLHAIRTGEIVLPFTEAEVCPEVRGSLDYWAINMYTRTIIDARRENGFGTRYEHKQLKMIDMPFYLEEMYPENMIAQLTRLYDKPIYITENGCSCNDDRFRIVYLALYLNSIREAMRMGADVRGYLYWSFMDNYEWNSFYPRFGLVDCDFETFKRTPKPSAYFYKEIMENNGFTQEILRKYLKELPTLAKI